MNVAREWKLPPEIDWIDSVVYIDKVIKDQLKRQWSTGKENEKEKSSTTTESLEAISILVPHSCPVIIKHRYQKLQK